jgi:hypothetical protein
VPRVAAHGAVDRGVAERQLLRVPGQRALGADRAREDGAHPVERLDRDDVDPRPQERSGHPARAGAHVEHARPAGRRRDRGDDVRLVAGPPALVGGRDVVEAPGQIPHGATG